MDIYIRARERVTRIMRRRWEGGRQNEDCNQYNHQYLELPCQIHLREKWQWWEEQKDDQGKTHSYKS